MQGDPQLQKDETYYCFECEKSFEDTEVEIKMHLVLNKVVEGIECPNCGKVQESE